MSYLKNQLFIMTHRVDNSVLVNVLQVHPQRAEVPRTSVSWVPRWLAENGTFLQVLSYLTPNGSEPEMLRTWQSERAFVQALQNGNHRAALVFAENLNPHKMHKGKSLLYHALEHNSIDIVFHFLRNHGFLQEEIERIAEKVVSFLPGDPNRLGTFKEAVDSLIEKGAARVFMQAALAGQKASWMRYLLPHVHMTLGECTDLLNQVARWEDQNEEAVLLILDLIQKGASPSQAISDQNGGGFTSVYLKALREGNLERVRVIREHFRDMQTTSDLLIACESGNVPLIQFLMNDRADLPGPRDTLEPGQKTPAQIFQAASNAVKVLMLQAGYEPTGRATHATPALLLQAVRMDMPEAIDHLLKKGVSMDYRIPGEGRSILEIAIKEGRSKALKTLIEFRALRGDSQRNHILHQACRENPSCVPCVLQLGPNVLKKIQGKSALTIVLEQLKESLHRAEVDEEKIRMGISTLLVLLGHIPSYGQLNAEERAEVAKIFAFLREEFEELKEVERKEMIKRCLPIFRGRMQDALMHMLRNGLHDFKLLTPYFTAQSPAEDDVEIAQTDRLSVLQFLDTNIHHQLDRAVSQGKLNSQAGAQGVAAVRGRFSRLKALANELQASNRFVGREKALLDAYATDIDNYIAFCHQMEQCIKDRTPAVLASQHTFQDER